MKKRLLMILMCMTLCGSLLYGCGDSTEVKKIQHEDAAKVKEFQHLTNEKCRRLIASYEYDVMMYERYKDSEDLTEQALASDAKFSANQTAEAYNAFVAEYKTELGELYEGVVEELEVIE